MNPYPVDALRPLETDTEPREERLAWTERVQRWLGSYLGDSTLVGRTIQSMGTDFWAHVDMWSSECWEWTGWRYPAGYGRASDGRGGQTYAHRRAWELQVGAIPDGLFVCHRCDNPPCCRGEHLFLGTPADNVHDRDAKGRGRRA